MKKPSILLVILLYTLSAFAQKAQVTILDDDIDGSPLEKEFNVHKGSTHKSFLPAKEERDFALKDLKQIQKWDELKKDIFYMELKSKSISEQKYPEFSTQELKTLKEGR
jgi:putative salt-induced outer membrane protein YdiY